eukprot:m.52345 g.52345  ORF g.52345 m.52345 type:complete len:80 (+) comp15408_c0_seq3:341-580(+)
MDAGLVTTLPDDVFNEFGDFMRAMCTRDAITMAEKLIFFHDQDARNALCWRAVMCSSRVLWWDRGSSVCAPPGCTATSG